MKYKFPGSISAEFIVLRCQWRSFLWLLFTTAWYHCSWSAECFFFQVPVHVFQTSVRETFLFLSFLLVKPLYLSPMFLMDIHCFRLIIFFWSLYKRPHYLLSSLKRNRNVFNAVFGTAHGNSLTVYYSFRAFRVSNLSNEIGSHR